jgi:hypothetical protein
MCWKCRVPTAVNDKLGSLVSVRDCTCLLVIKHFHLSPESWCEPVTAGVGKWGGEEHFRSQAVVKVKYANGCELLTIKTSTWNMLSKWQSFPHFRPLEILFLFVQFQNECFPWTLKWFSGSLQLSFIHDLLKNHDHTVLAIFWATAEKDGILAFLWMVRAGRALLF